MAHGIALFAAPEGLVGAMTTTTHRPDHRRHPRRRDRIDGAIDTPTSHSRTLSKMIGADVWLKFENLQFTAAYKERGALNKLLQLTDDERARGVIAASAGNHAQAVAYHGTPARHSGRPSSCRPRPRR